MRGARALALLLLACPIRAQEDFSSPAGERFVYYAPPSRSFACDIPADWSASEEETPRGKVSHILGPVEASGLWQVGYHIHVFDKEKPGFVSARDAMTFERRDEKSSSRQATQPVSWRIANKPARVFEVREERFLPKDRLPAKRVMLHHFYAFVASGGNEYIMIKLSATEATYLDYREEFKRLLKTFRIVGY
jgi:hypothetical protein